MNGIWHFGRKNIVHGYGISGVSESGRLFSRIALQITEKVSLKNMF